MHYILIIMLKHKNKCLPSTQTSREDYPSFPSNTPISSLTSHLPPALFLSIIRTSLYFLWR